MNLAALIPIVLVVMALGLAQWWAWNRCDCAIHRARPPKVRK